MNTSFSSCQQLTEKGFLDISCVMQKYRIILVVYINYAACTEVLAECLLQLLENFS
jgi:hypothetical protein